MSVAIKQVVTVGEGGVVEVRSDRLRAGTLAEVVVRADPGSTPPTRRTLGSFIGAGKGVHDSVEAVDAHVRQLRDEWRD